uniref:Uncharacterized protein n=1 Tax=Mycena chlorophos TaxID=658473 RepID=A0ABQ0KUF6_MYCCL|nr:predicted protein [Mycena chlorophos]
MSESMQVKGGRGGDGGDGGGQGGQGGTGEGSTVNTTTNNYNHAQTPQPESTLARLPYDVAFPVSLIFAPGRYGHGLLIPQKDLRLGDVGYPEGGRFCVLWNIYGDNDGRPGMGDSPIGQLERPFAPPVQEGPTVSVFSKGVDQIGRRVEDMRYVIKKGKHGALVLMPEGCTIECFKHPIGPDIEPHMAALYKDAKRRQPSLAETGLMIVTSVVRAPVGVTVFHRQDEDKDLTVVFEKTEHGWELGGPEPVFLSHRRYFDEDSVVFFKAITIVERENRWLRERLPYVKGHKMLDNEDALPLALRPAARSGGSLFGGLLKSVLPDGLGAGTPLMLTETGPDAPAVVFNPAAWIACGLMERDKSLEYAMAEDREWEEEVEKLPVGLVDIDTLIWKVFHKSAGENGASNPVDASESVKGSAVASSTPLYLLRRAIAGFARLLRGAGRRLLGRRGDE